MDVFVEKKQETIEKEVKTYVSFDGKNFSNEQDCLLYEYSCYIEKCKEVFELKSVCWGEDKYYSFKYSDGNNNLFQKMLEMFINLWNLDVPSMGLRDLSNVHKGRVNDVFGTMLKYKYKDGEIYLIRIIHECIETDDDFFNCGIRTKEMCSEEIMNMIEKYEKIFNIKQQWNIK